MIRPVFMLALIAGLAYSARSFPGASGLTSATLAFGFLLLACLQTGRLFYALHLPHLTGFLLTGLVFGPEVLNLLRAGELADLTLVKRVAVGFIALSAGCELNLKKLRPRLRAVGWLSVVSLSLALAALFGVLFVITGQLAFTADMTTGQRAVVALVGANALTALSPAVVVGIVSETRSAGPLTEMALSLVVVADLIVVIAFTMTETVVGVAFPVAGGGGGAASLAAHILGSLAVGALLGVVLAVYVARVGRKIGLFVFAVLFVVAEAGGVVHLDPLLAGLAAGLFLENVSDVGGDRVAREIEPVSLPTFAVFFGVVGAEIHVHDFLQVAPWALACAAVRAAGLSVGAVTTGRRMRLDPDLVRRIPYGLLPQAGVAIALALLVKQKFPPFGEGLSTLILGTIVVNELVGPVLWRAALVGAGEVGARREGAEAGHARRAATATPVPTTIDPTAG